MPRAAALCAICSLCLAPASAFGQAPPAGSPTPSGGPVFRTVSDAPAPPAAPATPPRVIVRLDYSRSPEACPDERGLRGAIATKLGYDPVSPVPGPYPLVRVSIVQQGGGFVARAEKRTPAGQVEWDRPPLMDADCRHLVEVLGLSIAIVLDPGALGTQAPPLPEPPASPPPSPPPLPAGGDHPAPPPPLAPPGRPKVHVGVLAGLELGTAPAATAGFIVQVGVRWPLWSLSAEVRGDLLASGSGNVAPMTRVKAGLLAGSLVPCGHVPLSGHWNIPVCAVLTLGAIRGEGLSVDVPKSGTEFYAAAGGRAGLEIPVNDAGSIALRLDGELLGVIKPVTITLNGHDAWTTSRVTGGTGGGVRVNF